MSDANPFAPPEEPVREEVDPFIRQTAARSMYRTAGGVIFSALLSWLINPCFMLTVLSVSMAIQGFRDVARQRRQLDVDFPKRAAAISQVLFIAGICLSIFGVFIRGLLISATR